MLKISRALSCPSAPSVIRFCSLPQHLTKSLFSAGSPPSATRFRALHVPLTAAAALPHRGGEQEQHGEDLQTAHQHVEGEQQLGPGAERGEVAHGTHDFQTGSDIVDAGRDRGKGRDEVGAVGSEQQRRDREDQHIHRQEQVDAAHFCIVQRLSLKAHGGDGVGVQEPSHVGPGGLAKDHDPGDLDPAAGGTRAGAHEHQDHQDHFGERGPQIEVRRAVARGGDDGGYLEQGVAQRLQHAPVEVPDLQRDQQHSSRHDPQIGSQLLRMEHLAESADQQEIVQIEVDPEHQHEHADHNVEIGTVVGTHAEVAAAEAAGARGPERVDGRVEQGHAPCQKEQDLDDGQHHVDPVEYLGGVAHPADQLPHCGARDLRP